MLFFKVSEIKKIRKVLILETIKMILENPTNPLEIEDFELVKKRKKRLSQ